MITNVVIISFFASSAWIKTTNTAAINLNKSIPQKVLFKLLLLDTINLLFKKATSSHKNISMHTLTHYILFIIISHKVQYINKIAYLRLI